jgi:thioesterase domain-containing protein
VDGGEKTPIVLMHTPSGHVISYQSMVEHLPEQHPVYGVQIDEIIADRKPYFSFSELTKFYAEQIKKQFPQGPVIIAGYCFGGLLGYEVACALKEANVEVERLFLIGAKFSAKNNQEYVIGESELNSMKMYVQKKKGLMRLKNYLYINKKSWQKKVWISSFNYFKTKNKELPDALFDLKNINLKIMEDHYPSVYVGEVYLIQPENKNEEDRIKTVESWKKLVNGKVHSITTEGGQSTLLKNPFSATLAEKIKQIIETEK